MGECVEVLARVQGGAHDGAVVAVRSGNALATSFHSELTGDDRVHGYFVDMVRAAGTSGGERGAPAPPVAQQGGDRQTRS